MVVKPSRLLTPSRLFGTGHLTATMHTTAQYRKEKKTMLTILIGGFLVGVMVLLVCGYWNEY